MASITVSLGAGVFVTDRMIWFQSSDLGPIFDANDEDQELSQVAIFATGTNAGLVTVSITGGNNRFTPEFEATGRFIFEASDGEMLEITIGNADMTEQYEWTPVNSAEVIAFGLHVRGLTDKTATLTLTDEAGDPPDHTAPSWTDDTGDAQAWTQNEAITPVTVPGASGTPVPDLCRRWSPRRHQLQHGNAGYQRDTHGGEHRNDHYHGHQLRRLRRLDYQLYHGGRDHHSAATAAYRPSHTARLQSSRDSLGHQRNHVRERRLTSRPTLRRLPGSTAAARPTTSATWQTPQSALSRC